MLCLTSNFFHVCKYLENGSLKKPKQTYLSIMDPRTRELRTLNPILYEDFYHTDFCKQPSLELFHLLFRVQFSEQTYNN